MIRGGHRGSPRGMGPRPGFYKPKRFIPRAPFDLNVVENFFTRVKPAPDESPLTQALLKKNQDLTPSAQEQTSVLNLITKAQAALDNLTVAPGTFDACQIEEVRQVGSFKKGTMIAGKNVGDIVVILKTLPTSEAIQGLASKVIEDLRQTDPKENLGFRSIVGGFEIFSPEATARILITTIPQNLRKLDPEIHLDHKVLRLNQSAIRHARWFEENAHHSSIRVLVHIFRDVCQRFEGFHPLNPWVIELLVHYSIMHHPSRQPLTLAAAFRRCFQLLAGGIFLPGSAGIPDPCDLNKARVHVHISLEEQDIICLTAQTLLRVLAHGGYKQILGLEGNASIATETSYWEGVVVSPLSKAYEKPPDKKEGEEESLEENMDTQE